MSANYPWWTPQVTGHERALLDEVLASNYLNEGELTARFEQEIAGLTGAKHAVAATSGTVALFLALAALGVGPGDEVLVPDVTFIATANAVRLSGATPVLVDVEPDRLTICPAALAAAITSRTRAIIPVHLSGRAADLAAILAIARAHDLLVIEDAAQAFMSGVRGQRLGTFGHAGCLSFSPNKTITTGQGGMVLTSDDALNVRLRALKDQGRLARGPDWDDVHQLVGYNFRLTNLQAAVGLGQLPALRERLERQARTHRLYAAELGGLPGITVPKFHLEDGEVPQWTDALLERRDELIALLRDRGAQCRPFWRPLHTQAPYWLPDDAFPNSVRLASCALWLPSAFTLKDEHVLRVCEHIREFESL
jgi:perosamine synthetase